MDEKLVRYIKENMERGHHPDKIKEILVKAGHDSKVIEEHIRHVHRKKKIPMLLTSAFAVIVLAMGVYYFSIQTGESAKPKLEIQSASYQDYTSIINEALVKNDLSLCDQIKNTKIMEECKAGFSSPRTECNEECKDKESLNLALIQHNSSRCLEIKSQSIRMQCEGAT